MNHLGIPNLRSALVAVTILCSLALAGTPAVTHIAAAPPVQVDVDLPSTSTGTPTGTLAVRIFAPATPAEARYADGAPVVIYVPGADDSGVLAPLLRLADDVIRIVFLVGIDEANSRLYTLGTEPAATTNHRLGRQSPSSNLPFPIPTSNLQSPILNLYLWFRAGQQVESIDTVLQWAIDHHATYIQNKTAKVPDAWAPIRNPFSAFSCSISRRIGKKTGFSDRLLDLSASPHTPPSRRPSSSQSSCCRVAARTARTGPPSRRSGPPSCRVRANP